MNIKQISNINNISGYVDRLSHAPTIKRETVYIQEVNESKYITRPKIEDINNLVIVHNQIEQYV